MSKLYLYFLQIVLKTHTFGKCDNDNSFGEQTKPTYHLIVSCNLASLSRFFTRTAKTSQSTQCLHSLFAQFCDAIFYPFEVLRLLNKVTI